MHQARPVVGIRNFCKEWLLQNKFPTLTFPPLLSLNEYQSFHRTGYPSRFFNKFSFNLTIQYFEPGYDFKVYSLSQKLSVDDLLFY